MLLGEISDQQRDIVLAFAERWTHNWKHVQAVIEIVAKLFVGDHRGKIAVGGGHKSNINPDRLRASEALELLLLQNPQQFGLQLQRNIADFVQK